MLAAISQQFLGNPSPEDLRKRYRELRLQIDRFTAFTCRELMFQHLKAQIWVFSPRLRFVVPHSCRFGLIRPACASLQRLFETDPSLRFTVVAGPSRAPGSNAIMEHMINPRAGQRAEPSDLINVPKLITAYYVEKPDPAVPEQRVAFGTSGHRGSAFDCAFNEWHILAITQAILGDYRRQQQIDGPLFIGIDTHALSEPALASALEVLAANGVTVMLADGSVYTPTPVVSHAIITYNHGRATGLADGIVVTPSHNPPADGGFKCNPPHGGPAGKGKLRFGRGSGGERVHQERLCWPACAAIGYTSCRSRLRRRTATVSSGLHRHDLKNVIDIRDRPSCEARISTLGVDPLGGAGVEYWGPIADLYKLNLKVVNTAVDPTFRFMTLDWDGKIRMDCSSPYAMRSLIQLNSQFDVAFGCDTDHDRHGIVGAERGNLLPPNALPGA